MNTRMHQEAFPGEDISDRPPPEDSVPGLLALIEGDLPSGRYRAARRSPGAPRERASPSSCPPGSRRASRPRRAGAPRDDGAAAGRPRGRRPLVHAPLPRPRRATSRRRPARRQRVGDAAGRAARAAARTATARRAPPLDPAPRDAATAGSSSCAATALPLPRARAAGEALDAARRRDRATLVAATPSAARLWVAQLDAARAGCIAYLARARAPDPLRHDAASGRSTTTRRSSPPSPAAPRCRAPAARSRRAASTRLVARGRRCRAARRCTPASPRSERGERPYPERYGVPRARPRAASTPRTAGGRVIAVGTTVVRALETVARRTAASHAGEGWTRPRRHAGARRPRRRRPAHRLARARGEPPADARGDRGRELLERSYAAALDARLPLARVRRHPPASCRSSKRGKRLPFELRAGEAVTRSTGERWPAADSTGRLPMPDVEEWDTFPFEGELRTKPLDPSRSGAGARR